MTSDLDRLATGLTKVREGGGSLDGRTIEQLLMLNLIERVQGASYKLSEKGAEILGHISPTLLVLPPTSANVKTKVAGLIKEQYNDTSIGEALGVNHYRTLGLNENMSNIGRFLGRIHPDDVIPTATVLGDATRVLASVVEALGQGRNNKVFIVGGGLEEIQSGPLIRHSVENYEQLVAGIQSELPRTFVDLSFIGNIPFGKFIDHEDLDSAIYYTVRYVLTGTHHPILNSKVSNRRMSLGSQNLKQVIDEEIKRAGFNRDEFNSMDNPMLVSEPVKGGQQWNKALVRETERLTSYPIAYKQIQDDTFLLYMVGAPCLFINEKGGSDLRTSVETTLDFGGLPDRNSLSIFGASEEEVTSTSVKAFVARIVSHAKLKPIGGGSFKPSQLEDLARDYRTQHEKILFILSYMLEKCEGIDGSQLQSILSLLIEFGVPDLTDALIERIQKRTRMTEELVEKYRIRVAEYNPKKYMNDFPRGLGELLTDNGNFFNDSAHHVGLGKELDAILEGLENGEAVVYIDETGYKDPSEGPDGDYAPMAERVRSGLIQRIMSGEVPDNLRNHSLVLVEGPAPRNEAEGLFAMLFGLVSEGKSINLESLRVELRKFIRYNPKTILILSLDAESFDASGFGEFIRLATSMGIKLIIEGKKDIPGTGRTIRTTPITEDELSDRVIEEIDDLKFHLGMEIDTRLCRKLFSTVARYRQDGDDPLWMVHQVLKVAKNSALGREKKTITGNDVSAGISYVLGVASVESMNENRAMIGKLPAILKKRIVGQDDVIDTFCGEFMSHMTGGGNPERPLSYLFPGPTGVGKTLFAEVTSRNFNLPFLSIDGSQYTESHTSQRLTSSPPGYVGSDKPGILTGFMEKHPGRGVVFVDEIDKMHPSVRLLLMNFFDEGKMTAGDGVVFRRPQYTIIVATNAGAERLRHGMTPREVLECIGEAFKDDKGTPKPELASRFRISPMLPVTEDAFKKAIRDNLFELELRAKMVANGIEITGVSDEAVSFVFQKIKHVCQKHNDNSRPIGFTSTVQVSDGYFNLREIVRCIDANMDGENIPTEKGTYRVILEKGMLSLAKE